MGVTFAAGLTSNGLGGQYGIWLGSDGRLMAMDGAGTAVWALTPDRNGVYRNGTWERIADQAYSRRFGNHTVDRLGRTVQHGGEFGTGVGRTAVFDPRTDTWTEYPSSLNPNHRPVGMASTGDVFTRIISFGTTGPAVTMTGFKPNYTDTTTANPSVIESGNMLPLNENQPVLTGGSFQSLVGFTARFAPYTGAEAGNQVFLRAGNLSNSGVYQDKSSAMAAFPADWRKLPSGRGLSWCLPGSVLPYESGLVGWMHKIQRVVLVGGDGFIYTVNPTNGDLARHDVLPAPELVNPGNGNGIHNGYVGTLATDMSTQLNTDTPTIPPTLVVQAPNYAFSTWRTQYLTASAATVSNGHTPIIHLRTDNNAKAIACTYTGLSLSGGLFTYTGVSRLTSNVWRSGGGGQLKTGPIEVWSAQPFLYAADGGGTVLPNGDLVFHAGSTEVDGDAGTWPTFGAFYQWDGTSTPARRITPVVSASPFYNLPTPLPDGSYFSVTGFGLGASGQYMIPDGADAIPLAGMAPIVTTFPSTVVAGSTVLLTGSNINGQIPGCMQNDEGNVVTDFPIGRFQSATGQVAYAICCRIATRGAFAGANSCSVEIPESLERGDYQFSIVAGGVRSNAVNVAVVGAPAPSPGLDWYT